MEQDERCDQLEATEKAIQRSTHVILWMDKIHFAPTKKPQNDMIRCEYQQTLWFPMVSWVVQDLSIHFISGSWKAASHCSRKVERLSSSRLLQQTSAFCGRKQTRFTCRQICTLFGRICVSAETSEKGAGDADGQFAPCINYDVPAAGTSVDLLPCLCAWLS